LYILSKSKIISPIDHLYFKKLPSYPGNGIPAENIGGFKLCPNPRQLAVIE